jgi:hypothetical protein
MPSCRSLDSSGKGPPQSAASLAAGGACRHNSRAQLGDQFFHRVALVAKALAAEIPIKAGLLLHPVGELVKSAWRSKTVRREKLQTAASAPGPSRL